MSYNIDCVLYSVEHELNNMHYVLPNILQSRCRIYGI